MATRQQLQQLAKLRLTEAERLHASGLYDGATYLCGYVLEFALKARICKLLRLKEYPDKKDELGRLVDNWSIAALWKPEQRYFPKGTVDKKKAEEVLASVKDDPNGVLTWLTKRW